MRKDGIVNGDCWVTCIDILGFRNHILDFERQNGKGCLHTYVKNYYEDILDELKKSGEYWLDKVRIWWASDTFVFYTLDDSVESFTCIQQETIHFCVSLIWKSFAFRGALATGQLYVDVEPKRNRNILVGSSFIEAYEYAEKQNWIGFVLTPSAYSKLKVLGLNPVNLSATFVEFDVPVKNKEMAPRKSTEKLFSARIDKYPMVHNCIKQMQSECKNRHKEEYKTKYKSIYENTLRFFGDIQKNTSL